MNNTIQLIAEGFKAHDIKFQTIIRDEREEIQAAFGIKNGGPLVYVRFIPMGQGNDLSVRALGLMNEIAADKRARILEACNELNNMYRFVKFCLTSDGGINVEYDMLREVDNSCIGECAFELFVRMIQILNNGYSVFVKALYDDPPVKGGTDPQKEQAMANLLRMLREKHDHVDVKISKLDTGEE